MAKNKATIPEKPQFYGRRKGHPLRPHRQQLMNELLPKLVISPDSSEPLDPLTLFEDKSDIWLEIGFGAGEHLAAQAAANPAIGFIGCEPYINGVATLLSVIEREELSNIRLYSDDARMLLDQITPASISKVFVLFSDPWPKTRHHRRRFINPENLDALARIMKEGAEFRFATDDMSFLRWSLNEFYHHPDFNWLAEGPDNWRLRYADAAPTRYETKALKQGKKCVYLTFQRQVRK
ncbi:MAG: tRNA (guanosine(46)-N7)-methyltransferase TrmB [Rhodospirillaceae bacterium]|jgi:tRNA (guanine-N7-)-methyltransferase|nr:tRNA (guanosine(46)-N7)-methyltransferase TrmB [Rhodospirillaceae bacterium]MBT4590297.1 tRNA (guanosine(46)-N7)-methyltransferase TrmB [Rhodospirillaceae bacterium]MBT4939798.1 tRNA (guanosine(46)-N7)-methyltransferase TrmB [Rhodospirillaceae bacterium]MBT5938558.1 tRNA (guanosine(46)-N7)-methyltransferase TrmB [Rhodospirillaceae bacterium]MBT7266003.1 tRNA (guanosine(46)-N7)-methyltransferase TrmB [Rhodospirillaceae bacterium]